MKSRRAGFTLVEIMIVVAILGLLAAVAVASLVKVRSQTQEKLCLNNLRIIDDAIHKVMTVSNFSSSVSCDTGMLAEFMKNRIEQLDWPDGVTVSNGTLSAADDSNWEAAIDAVDIMPLSVTCGGKLITLHR